MWYYLSTAQASLEVWSLWNSHIKGFLQLDLHLEKMHFIELPSEEVVYLRAWLCLWVNFAGCTYGRGLVLPSTSLKWYQMPSRVKACSCWIDAFLQHTDLGFLLPPQWYQNCDRLISRWKRLQLRKAKASARSVVNNKGRFSGDVKTKIPSCQCSPGYE